MGAGAGKSPCPDQKQKSRTSRRLYWDQLPKDRDVSDVRPDVTSSSGYVRHSVGGGVVIYPRPMPPLAAKNFDRTMTGCEDNHVTRSNVNNDISDQELRHSSSDPEYNRL